MAYFTIKIPISNKYMFWENWHPHTFVKNYNSQIIYKYICIKKFNEYLSKWIYLSKNVLMCTKKSKHLTQLTLFPFFFRQFKNLPFPISWRTSQIMSTAKCAALVVFGTFYHCKAEVNIWWPYLYIWKL